MSDRYAEKGDEAVRKQYETEKKEKKKNEYKMEFQSARNVCTGICISVFTETAKLLYLLIWDFIFLVGFIVLVLLFFFVVNSIPVGDKHA